MKGISPAAAVQFAVVLYFLNEHFRLCQRGVIIRQPHTGIIVETAPRSFNDEKIAN